MQLIAQSIEQKQKESHTSNSMYRSVASEVIKQDESISVKSFYETGMNFPQPTTYSSGNYQFLYL
jgi:hypothetical protein